jgi:PAS domain S-box-containing protein
MLHAPPNPAWLERLPLPAGVIRSGRFVYVNTALAELVGYTREAMTNMEFFTPVAEEDRQRIRERHLKRLGGEPVADSYEFDVVRADGERRHVEIWVAQVGGDTVFQLYDRTATGEHEKKLLALAHLGAAVQAEQTRDGVLAKIEAGAAALGLVTMRVEPKGDGIVVTAFRTPGLVAVPFEKAVGIAMVGRERPWSPATRDAWRDGISYVDDMPMNVHAFFGDAADAVRDFARHTGYLRAVFLRIDEGGAPSHVLVLTSTWLQPEDVPTLSLFGAQITAALAAARSIADLSQRNDELAALNRLATSAGTMTDSTALFARGSAALAEVVRCTDIAFYLLRPEEGVAVLAYVHGKSAADLPGDRARIPLKGTRLGEVAREGKPRVLHIEDYADSRSRQLLVGLDYQTVVALPLIARAEVIGVMHVSFVERRTLEPREIEFLQAAAAHFAAAIEASRLVDDLRRSYVDLSRAQEQLVHRERLAALGEMAAAVAHEVRNPLGVIFNSVGSLRRLVGNDRGDAEMLIGIIAEEAVRLNDIVGDLLDFARPLKPELQEGSLTEVVREAIRSAVATTGDRIVVELVTEEPVLNVPLDARLLRQAILNVALNAVQSIEGPGTLRIRISSIHVADAAHARVEITDSGPGIPAEHLPRVFEPFFTTRPKGTGLGLAVVKRIVEGHRGRVSVTSEPGTATAFVIDLPAEQG